MFLAKSDPPQRVVPVSSVGEVGIPEPHQMSLWLLPALSNAELTLALAYE